MAKQRKPRDYWNSKLRVKKEAQKYTSRSMFRKGSGSAYNAARRNDWLEEICSHMHYVEKPKGFWKEKENVLSDALKYRTRTEWSKESGSAYNVALYKGWLDETCAHMDGYSSKPQGHWNIKENVLEDAKNYNSRKKWSIGSCAAYKSALEHGWGEEACSHMVRTIMEAGHWDVKKHVIDEANKYSHPNEWRKKSRGSHNAAHKHGWVVEAYANMNVQRGPYKKVLSKIDVLNDAKCYSSRTEWRKGNKKVYKLAKAGKYFESACAHMKHPISDEDSVYIWRVKDQYLNKKPLYKIGMTSWRLRGARVEQGAKVAGFKSELIKIGFVGKNKGRSVELKLLAIGDSPKFSGFPGCKEYRAMDNDELFKAISILEQYIIPNPNHE